MESLNSQQLSTDSENSSAPSFKTGIRNEI